MLRDIDQFFLSREEPAKSCLLALRQIILQQDPAISESVKYGIPCFSYGKKMFCFLWTEKKTGWPYILFVEGKRLDHPLLDAGDRKRMKVLRMDPEQDLPVDVINTLLQEALDLYRNGTIRIS